MTNTTDPARFATARAEPERPTGVRSIWTAAAVSGITAAAVTTAVGAVGRAAGVALTVSDQRIPLLGFVNLTLLGALIGAVLATALHLRARRPRRTFVVTTVVLTVLSIAPGVLVDTSPGTRALLAGMHVLAACIIVPAVAARVRC